MSNLVWQNHAWSAGSKSPGGDNGSGSSQFAVGESLLDGLPYLRRLLSLHHDKIRRRTSSPARTAAV